MASYNNNFLDWYKQNYNADYDPNKGYGRVDGISDQDWEVGNNLFNAYTRKNDLTNQMNSSQATMDANKTKQQQMASIQLDKLKKYLPTQIKAQGLGGLGVSESSMLQANNSYQNTMGNIDGDYNKSQMELLNSYNSNVSAIDEEQTNRNQGIFDKYTEIERLEKEKADQIERERLETERIAKESADKLLYGNVAQAVENMIGDYTVNEYKKISAADKKKIEDYISKNANDLPDSMKKSLNAILEQAETMSPTEEEKSATEENKNKQDGKVFVGKDGSLSTEYKGKTMFSEKEVGTAKSGFQAKELWSLLDPTRMLENIWGGISSIWGGGYAGKEKEINKWMKKAEAGGLENGSIIDADWGRGQHLVMFYNDKYYLMK